MWSLDLITPFVEGHPHGDGPHGSPHGSPFGSPVGPPLVPLLVPLWVPPLVPLWVPLWSPFGLPIGPPLVFLLVPLWPPFGPPLVPLLLRLRFLPPPSSSSSSSSSFILRRPPRRRGGDRRDWMKAQWCTPFLLPPPQFPHGARNQKGEYNAMQSNAIAMPMQCGRKAMRCDRTSTRLDCTAVPRKPPGVLPLECSGALHCGLEPWRPAAAPLRPAPLVMADSWRGGGRQKKKKKKKKVKN